MVAFASAGRVIPAQDNPGPGALSVFLRNGYELAREFLGSGSRAIGHLSHVASATRSLDLRLPQRVVALAWVSVLLAFGVALGVANGRAASVSGPVPPPPLPRLLSETGLYLDGDTRTVDPKNLPYSPQYALWTDGATKRRWVRLPDGQRIDASNPDRWVF